MPQIGWLEILAVVISAILVLGPKEFPIALKKIGSYFRKLKNTLSSFQREVTSVTDDIDIEKNLNNQKEKNKEGNETPHYFHYIEQDEEGNPKSDNCVGCGVIEWLKDHNTCPCCRFELPIEEDKKNNELNKPSNVDVDEDENNEGNTENLQTPPQSESYQEDLLRSILGLVANNEIGRILVKPVINQKNTSIIQ